MRFPSGKVVATYSHTDNQVRFLVKFSLFSGIVMGFITALAIRSAF